MKTKFMVVLCVIMCLASASAEAAPSLRLGVMKFLNRSDGISADQAAAVGDIVARMLTHSKTISVIERDQLDAIASEHQLATTGMITDESAVRIGKLAGCQYMALGAVTNYEKSGKSTNVFIWGTQKYHAAATIDVRIVDVETSEVKLSLSETGMASQTGTHINFYGLTDDKIDFSGLEAGAIADAASRLSYKIRDALTGEYSQVIEEGRKDITLDIGMTAGAQIGGLYRVYVDGKEVRGADGKKLGHRRDDIAIVKIVDVQTDFSIAESAGKNTGNISLIRKGDKIFPISVVELQALTKRANFPKARPKKIELDEDLAKFLNSAR